VSHDVERPVTVPELARMAGVHRDTMHRRVVAMCRRDAEFGSTGWMTRTAGGQIRINLSMLRNAHPEMFTQDYVGRNEYEDLLDRVRKLEASQEADREDIVVVAEAVRALRRSSS
jgi:hypothetical protein